MGRKYVGHGFFQWSVLMISANRTGSPSGWKILPSCNDNNKNYHEEHTYEPLLSLEGFPCPIRWRLYTGAVGAISENPEKETLEKFIGIAHVFPFEMSEQIGRCFISNGLELGYYSPFFIRFFLLLKNISNWHTLVNRSWFNDTMRSNDFDRNKY